MCGPGNPDPGGPRLGLHFFCDNNFNFPEEQAEGICREITRQKVPLRWTAYVNPGFMTEPFG